MGFALAANAQADQCKLEGGNGGYINAYVSDTQCKDGGCTGGPKIGITTEPSKDQPSDGKVICKIIYVTKDGETEEITRSLYFYKSGSYENIVKLDSKASRIKSIEIWGAECKSASRTW